MPTCDLYGTPKQKDYSWKALESYERKQWHKNNAASIAWGKGPLNKNNITWKDLK